jgi:hypothetical protein
MDMTLRSVLQHAEELVVLPEGDFDLECISAAAIKSQGGTPAISTRLKVIGGPYAGKVVKLKPYYLTERSAGVFLQNLVGWGWTREGLEAVSLEEVAASLVGRIVRVRVTVDTYEGQDRNTHKPGQVKLLSNGEHPAGVQAPPVQVQAPPPPVQDVASPF